MSSPARTGNSVSTPRSKMKYLGCGSGGTSCARGAVSALALDRARGRTFSASTNSAITATTFSIGECGSGTCWSGRSIESTPRLRRLLSAAFRRRSGRESGPEPGGNRKSPDAGFPHQGFSSHPGRDYAALRPSAHASTSALLKRTTLPSSLGSSGGVIPSSRHPLTVARLTPMSSANWVIVRTSVSNCHSLLNEWGRSTETDPVPILSHKDITSSYIQWSQGYCLRQERNDPVHRGGGRGIRWALRGSNPRPAD